VLKNILIATFKIKTSNVLKNILIATFKIKTFIVLKNILIATFTALCAKGPFGTCPREILVN
jgi:hypothetical protein